MQLTLKGEQTPVEQAIQFELIVNMKTVNAPGITIPRAALVRADKVIE